jgi:hypothetical protein
MGSGLQEESRILKEHLVGHNNDIANVMPIYGDMLATHDQLFMVFGTFIIYSRGHSAQDFVIQGARARMATAVTRSVCSRRNHGAIPRQV